MMVHLSKTVSLLLAIFSTFSQATRQNGCWTQAQYKRYLVSKEQQKLPDTQVDGNLRCRSYCFDLNQLGSTSTGGCNVFSVGFGYYNKKPCYLSKTSLPKVAGRLMSDPKKSLKFLQNACEVGRCWSPSTLRITSLRIVRAKDETHCRFICLETPNCFYLSYRTEECFIDFGNVEISNEEETKTRVVVLVLSEERQGKIQVKKVSEEEHFEGIVKLNNKCKAESCWLRHHERDIKYSSLVKLLSVRDELSCRWLCYQKKQCRLFQWRIEEKGCYIMEVSIRKPASFSSAYTDENLSTDVISYEMKEECFE